MNVIMIMNIDLLLEIDMSAYKMLDEYSKILETKYKDIIQL